MLVIQRSRQYLLSYHPREIRAFGSEIPYRKGTLAKPSGQVTSARSNADRSVLALWETLDRRWFQEVVAVAD
jgi:hypothetical protein